MLHQYNLLTFLNEGRMETQNSNIRISEYKKSAFQVKSNILIDYVFSNKSCGLKLHFFMNKKQIPTNTEL